MTIPNSLKEALLEGARVVMLAVVSFLLTVGVIDQVVLAWFGANLAPQMQVIVIGLFTSVLRGIDKWLHENAKDTGNADSGYLQSKGLTGF